MPPTPTVPGNTPAVVGQHLPQPSAEPATEVLRIALSLQLLTVALLVLHTNRSPDACYRLLQRLTADGLLQSAPWRPATSAGPPSNLYALTSRGLLAVSGENARFARALGPVVRRTSARLRDVRAGLITTVGHDLAVRMLHGLFLQSNGASASPRAISVPFWNPGLKVPLTADLGRLTSRELDRLGPGVLPGGTVTYVPDLALLLRHASAPGRTDAGTVLVEVETGKGGRRPAEIGAVKALKMTSVFCDIRANGGTYGLGRVNVEETQFLVWCPTAAFRDAFLKGVRRVAGDDLPVFATSSAEIPLDLPSGLSKSEVLPWFRRISSALRTPVWLDTSGAARTPFGGHLSPTVSPALPPQPLGSQPNAPSSFDLRGETPYLAL